MLAGSEARFEALKAAEAAEAWVGLGLGLGVRLGFGIG